jgi:sulfite reductase (NADPH) hemoprotein beta-component
MDGPSVNADPDEVARIAAYFAPPEYETLPAVSSALDAARALDPEFDRFCATNLFAHKVPGYTAITVSAKPIGLSPGDVSSDQMRALADLAERYSKSELRITHVQNVVLPHVKLDDLADVWAGLVEAGLATANVGLITDIISCPGMDYCKLATARSIPIAQEISKRFADPDLQAKIGLLGIKISGCINACGHHHVGAIGILGLDKAGAENYQITLGGEPGDEASLGVRLGPGIDGDEVPGAIERLVDIYLALRASAAEPFIETVRRVGLDPFKPALQNEEKIRAAA